MAVMICSFAPANSGGKGRCRKFGEVVRAQPVSGVSLVRLLVDPYAFGAFRALICSGRSAVIVDTTETVLTDDWNCCPVPTVPRPSPGRRPGRSTGAGQL